MYNVFKFIKKNIGARQWSASAANSMGSTLNQLKMIYDDDDRRHHIPSLTTVVLTTYNIIYYNNIGNINNNNYHNRIFSSSFFFCSKLCRANGRYNVIMFVSSV